jgi:hypothetical protein
VADGPARLFIDFKGGPAQVAQFLAWLREEDSSLAQPFGMDVNAFPATAEDHEDVAPENVYILTPGTRVLARTDRGETPLLEHPENAPVTTSVTDVQHQAPPRPPVLGTGGGDGGVAPY